VLQRTYDWFSGLSLAQKALVVGFALLLWFLAIFLISTAIFQMMPSGSERANAPSEESSTPRPNTRVPEVTTSSARWEGQKAVVKGSWKGEISAVYCKILEGGSSGESARGLRHEVQMDPSEHTFTQESVAARESEGGESLDPEASYSAVCYGLYGDDLRTDGATAEVEGTPPG
jgi:hypothetical protein